MPVYDYKCKKCEKIFEVEHKIGDTPMKFCPSCGGELKKIYHPVGIVFKGSGFHVTDYRKETKKEEKPKETKASKN